MTIRIDSNEEITSVIDRLRAAKTKKIYLVIPQNSYLLGSLVNLRLLKKEAQRREQKIIIITQDRIGRSLASRSGFAVKQILGEKAVVTHDIKPTFVKEIKTKEISPKENINKREKIQQAAKEKTAKNATDWKTPFKIKPNYQGGFYQGPYVPIKVLNKKPRFFLQRKKNKDFFLENLNIRKKKSQRKIQFILPSLDRKIFFGFVFTASVIILTIAFVLLPKAEIIVYPKFEPLRSEETITISAKEKEINFSAKILPGLFLEDEQSIEETFRTEGKKEVGVPAKGKAILYNKTGEEQTIKNNTRLATEDGLIFKTQSKITIPSQGSKEVEIIADFVGEKGNISPQRLNLVALPKATQLIIFAETKSNLSGGSSKKISIVSEDDVRKAKENLAKKIFGKQKDELSRVLPKTHLWLPQSTKQIIIDYKVDPKEESEAENFKISVKSKISGIAFNLNDAKKLFSRILQSKTSENKEILFSKEIMGVDDFKEIKYNDESQETKATVILEGAAFIKFDEEKTKENLSGRTVKEAEEYLLGMEGVKGVNIKLSPFWVQKVPGISKKIYFTFDTRGKQ